MIHYPVTLNQLVLAMNSTLGTKPKQDSWWYRAHQDFLRAVNKKSFDAKKTYWPDVKGAFIQLQCDKCAYCELPMPIGSKSRIAYDVEHHRPKSRTMVWPDAKTQAKLKIGYQVASGRGRGYPELAHHAYNYAVACKVCNSPYKRDYFPLLGTADQNNYAVDELNRNEKPAVPLPLGDWGEDPASFLTFEGFIAVAASNQPAKQRRAQIVIDFFELNRRPDLLLGRATAVSLVYQHLKEIEKPDSAKDSDEARQWVAADVHDSAPYAAVTRAFVEKYTDDLNGARNVARLANRYLSKKSMLLAKSLVARLPANVQSMEQVLALLD